MRQGAGSYFLEFGQKTGKKTHVFCLSGLNFDLMGISFDKTTRNVSGFEWELWQKDR